MTTPAIVEPQAANPPVAPAAIDFGDVVPVELAPEAVVPEPETAVVPETGTATPEPTPAVSTPVATAPPSEVDQLRRRLAQVEAERQEQATEAALVQSARSVQQAALARGLSEEDALWVAQQHYGIARRVSQQESQLRQQQQYLQDKQDYAAHVAREHGVSPSLLMTANTPEDMVAIAVREKRYMALEADIKALKQGQVPAQRLNRSGVGAAAGVTVTAENIDKLWLDFETLHPGMANPYEAAYRRLLGG